MYRNFGSNRSRFGQNRTSDFSNDRDRNRRNWQDNRPRNDESDSDSEYRRINNFRHIDNNTEIRENSRYSDSTNSSNFRNIDPQVAENQFSTPGMNSNVREDMNSPFNQQFQSILGQPILQSTTTNVNHHNQQYQGFQQPNIPISPFSNHNNTINQRINFSPSLNNAAGPPVSDFSIAPMARLPTFTPVSSPQAQGPNPTSTSNSSRHFNSIP